MNGDKLVSPAKSYSQTLPSLRDFLLVVLNDSRHHWKHLQLEKYSEKEKSAGYQMEHKLLSKRIRWNDNNYNNYKILVFKVLEFSCKQPYLFAFIYWRSWHLSRVCVSSSILQISTTAKWTPNFLTICITKTEAIILKSNWVPEDD